MHAVNVERLPPHILCAHVDDTLHAEARADRGAGYAVLSGSGLGDNAALAHAPGKQSLAKGIVDFVRAGVAQVFALEVDLRATDVLGKALGKGERRGTARVVAQHGVELVLKVLVAQRRFVSRSQLG